MNATDSNRGGSLKREGVLINTEDAETLAESISMKPINAMAYTPTINKNIRGGSHLGSEKSSNSLTMNKGGTSNKSIESMVESSQMKTVDSDNMIDGDNANSMSRLGPEGGWV